METVAPRPHLYVLALAVGMLGVVAALLFARLGLAVVLAALVVPAIGVVYACEARVHARVPIAALALAAMAGSLSGAVLTLLARQYVEQFGVAQMTAMAEGRPSLSLVLLLGITAPLLGDLLALVGPLPLRRWPGVRHEVVDGVILGVVSGVGFAAMSTLVNYWPLIRDGYTPTGVDGVLDWTATLVGLSVLRPLVHGATSGLIAAGVWAAMLGRGQVAVPVAVGFGGSMMYSLADFLFLSRGSFMVLAVHGVLLAVLLVTLRFTIREGASSGADRAPATQP